MGFMCLWMFQRRVSRRPRRRQRRGGLEGGRIAKKKKVNARVADRVVDFRVRDSAEGVRRSGDPDRDGRHRGETRSRPGRVTHISDHCASLGNGEGFVGKFCGAYCPTLRPPRGRPSRIKSRECPELRSEAPGSDFSLGSAVGMVRVRGARVDRRAFFVDGGKANARALWRDRILSPRARACASRGRTSRLAKKRRGFGGDGAADVRHAFFGSFRVTYDAIA